jgi:hypothetical protein
MIEYRKIQPPVQIPAEGPYDAIIADLVAKTPPRRALFAGKYEYPLPEANKIGALRVLRNGHGLLRVIPPNTDVKDIRSDVELLHLSEPGERRVLMDVVPGSPGLRAITHLFIFRRGYSPGWEPKRLS